MAELPLHIRDQVDAATEDTARTFILTTLTMAATGELDGGVETVRKGLVEQLLRRCRICPHLTGSNPQPSFALMGIKLICCSRCLHDAVETLKEQQDQTCDVCLKEVPSNVFSEFTIHSGPVILFGNRGRCCDDLRKKEK